MTAMAEVVVDAERITPQWLSRALSTPVRAVTATPVGTGQMGSVFRLEIDGESAPARLMAKLPAADPAARAMVAGAYRQEIRFYREIAPTVSVRVPTCHFAEFAGDGAEFTLLLDDLAPARQGDQIADARWRRRTRRSGIWRDCTVPAGAIPACPRSKG